MSPCQFEAVLQVECHEGAFERSVEASIDAGGRVAVAAGDADADGDDDAEAGSASAERVEWIQAAPGARSEGAT